MVCDSLHGRFFMDFPTSCPTSSFFFAHLLTAGKSATRVLVQLRPTAYGAGSAQPEEDLAESHRASANGPYLKGGGGGGWCGKVVWTTSGTVLGLCPPGRLAQTHFFSTPGELAARRSPWRVKQLR